MNREEKKIMGLTTASHSLVHLFEGVLPPLIPLLIADFATDYFHLGIIVSVFSYAFGIGSLPAGFLADKLGPRRLVTFFLFGAGFLSALVFFIPSLLAYGIIMGFIGLFCSMYHPASNTLISQSIREKGKAFGIHGIAGSLGVASVPVLSAWFGSNMGWRVPHVIFGFMGIAAAVYSFSVPAKSAFTAESPDDKNRPEKEISYLKLIVFYCSAAALGLTYKGIMTFLPAYMGEKIHFGFLTLNKVTLGGSVATLALVSGALGQYFGGRLVDRFRPENIYSCAIIFGTFFVFIMAKSSGLILIISAILYAFFYFSTQPMQNFLLSNYLPKKRHGIGYGIHFFVTFGIGSTAAAVSGYLADNYGLESVFYAMGACFVVSSILSLILVARAGRQEA
ncbi:MAG: MFS transporter [Pseudomonadota bacterium]